MESDSRVLQALSPATRERFERLRSIENDLAAWRHDIDRRPGNALRDIAAVVVGIALFAAILSGPPPLIVALLRTSGIGWCAALTLVIVELAGYRASILRKRGAAVLTNAARFAVPVLAFVLAAIPTANLWQAGEGGYFVIGGLLPWSDASDYYQGAVAFTEEGRLDSFSQRRPVNAAINGLKLRIGGSLKGWIITGSLAIGFGLLLAGREIALLLGPGAAIAFMTAVSGHTYPYNSATMSEANGTLLGLLAAAILLAAIRLRDRRWLWAGLFLAALALDTRAGAFFTLPLLLLWGALNFGKTHKQRLGIAVVGVLMFLLAFLPARIYDGLWGDKSGGMHANFASTLYGMAAGDKGWRQIFVDHPEIANLGGEGAQSKFMYRRAFDLILENPGRFAWLLVRDTLVFVPFHGVFLNQVTALSLFVLLLALFRWRHRVSTLFLVTFLGTALSAPFLMWDAGPRAFAATVPIVAISQALAIGAIGVLLIALLFKSLPDVSREPAISDYPAPHLVPVAAISLTVVLLAAPFGLAGRYPPPRLPAEPPVLGKVTLAFVPGQSGEWLEVYADDRLARPWVPQVRETPVMRDLMKLEHEIPHFPLERRPVCLGFGVDARGKTSFGAPTTWFTTPTGMRLPRTKRPLLLAGDGVLTPHQRFYVRVREVFVLSEDGRSWQPYLRERVSARSSS